MRNINSVTTKKSDHDESVYSFSSFSHSLDLILTLLGSDFVLNNISFSLISFNLPLYCFCTVVCFQKKGCTTHHFNMKDVQGECNGNFAPT